MKFKGSKTEKNLLAAFAGESQARNRYTFFASAAKKEGYEQIAALFLETAENEKEHAKRFFKFLEGGMAEFTATFPAGRIGTTAENLKAAAEGENEEWTKLYPGSADVAEQEGFREWQRRSAPSQRSRSSTRNGTGSCWRTWRRGRCSGRTNRPPGSAATADTSMRAPRRPRSARPASIRRPSSNWRRRTIDILDSRPLRRIKSDRIK